MGFTIADILMQQGREAAAARQNRGALWGNLVQYAGTLPREVLAGQQAEQDRARAIAAQGQQSQANALNIQKSQRELQQMDDAHAKTQALGQVYAQAFDPQTGKLDPAKAHQAVVQTGRPDLHPLIDEVIQHGKDAELGAALKQSEITKNAAQATESNAKATQALRPPVPIQRDPTKDLLNPTDLSVVSPGVPAVKPDTRALNQQLLDALKNGDVNGAALIRKAMREGAESTHITVNTGAGQNTDVADTVSGMIDGTSPPILPGRGPKEYIALTGEAHRRGFDLAAAATDWMATQKHIATMNGSQQLRLNQSINQLPELLDSVDALASKWKGGRFPILNKANLVLAKGGAYGQEAASIARQLDAQIADVTADLGNVYMGGNSPTDHALGLAAKALSAEWDEKGLHDMVTLARNNVKTRQNSIRNTGVAGASEGNPYAPKTTPTPAPSTGGGLSYDDYLKGKK